MRILITNDDGIHAPGLGVLEGIAAELSDDIWTVAPETDQSGLSHSLSLSDPLRLRQVIHNLVKNAQEALDGTASGRVRVASSMILEADKRLVELQVEDDGPGFGAELLGRLFEPYVTTKAEGTGLGMAIAYRIVTDHGGFIDADNRAEGGARVRIRMPLHGGEARA